MSQIHRPLRDVNKTVETTNQIYVQPTFKYKAQDAQVLVPLISIEVLQLHAAVRFVWKCGIPSVYRHRVGNMMINPIHWIFNQVFVLMINPLNMWIWGMPYFAGQTQLAVTSQFWRHFEAFHLAGTNIQHTRVGRSARIHQAKQVK